MEVDVDLYNDTMGSYWVWEKFLTGIRVLTSLSIRSFFVLGPRACLMGKMSIEICKTKRMGVKSSFCKHDFFESNLKQYGQFLWCGKSSLFKTSSSLLQLIAGLLNHTITKERNKNKQS